MVICLTAQRKVHTCYAFIVRSILKINWKLSAQACVNGYVLTRPLFQEYIMTSSPSRQQVLQLYRALLQYGKTLEYTDQDYFMRRIRKEFQKNKTLVSSEEKQFYFGKGLSFLSKQRLIWGVFWVCIYVYNVWLCLRTCVLYVILEVTEK